MRDGSKFQNKKKSNHFLYSKPFLLGIIIVLGIFAYNLSGIVGKAQETKENKDQALRKKNELLDQQANLSSMIDKLRTDEGKEEIIRENFRVAKGDEGLVVILNDSEKKNLEEDSEKSKGFIEILKSFFKKKDNL